MQPRDRWKEMLQPCKYEFHIFPKSLKQIPETRKMRRIDGSTRKYSFCFFHISLSKFLNQGKGEKDGCASHSLAGQIRSRMRARGDATINGVWFEIQICIIAPWNIRIEIALDAGQVHEMVGISFSLVLSDVWFHRFA
jgi:hypothetical protein